MPPKACLDHIIILVPYADVLNPPKWVTDNFTITPGGRHADNKTENKLILFQDGSYIELIAFIDDEPKHREGHWWGEKKNGIIDFACTTDEDAVVHWTMMNERLKKAGGDMRYSAPRQGGRVKDTGENVIWKVTFPPTSVRRGELPFFCHDVTSRNLRVPITAESVKHPSGAYGIKSLHVMLSSERALELGDVYPAVLDVENNAGRFEVGSVHPVERASPPKLRLQTPRGENQERKVEERGMLLGDLVIGGFKVDGGPESGLLDADAEMGGIYLDLD
jgi:hypothetical protein